MAQLSGTVNVGVVKVVTAVVSASPTTGQIWPRGSKA